MLFLASFVHAWGMYLLLCIRLPSASCLFFFLHFFVVGVGLRWYVDSFFALASLDHVVATLHVFDGCIVDMGVTLCFAHLPCVREVDTVCEAIA